MRIYTFKTIYNTLLSTFIKVISMRLFCLYRVTYTGLYKILRNSAYEPYQHFNLEEDPYEQTPLDTNMTIFNELKNHLS